LSAKNRNFYQTRANLLDPDNNIIEAKDFIPILEKTNLLKAFDRWIIRFCISELAKLNIKKEGGVGLFIILSEQSINDKGLTDWISKLIEYVKMPKLGTSLVFEIDAKCFKIICVKQKYRLINCGLNLVQRSV
jgi:FOG: EAL domain